MIKIECPFMCLFMDEIDCPYIENLTQCHNIEVTPGNGDAWCSGKIEEALGRKTGEKPCIPMRQNYSCALCGLKSFVIYSSNEDVFDIATKIRTDHEKREPACPCPVDDLYIAGEPTEV